MYKRQPNAPDESGKVLLPVSATHTIALAILIAALGFASNSGWTAIWLGASVFSFMGVFTATAIILAVAGGYLIIRQGGVWVTFAVFGVTAVLLLFVWSPNYADAAKLIAVQSIIQMAWTITLTLLLKRENGRPLFG